MPLYEIRIGGLTVSVSKGGPVDSAGLRRAAFIEASDTLGVLRVHGVHGILVPDADDEAATEVEIERGQHDGVWLEKPTKRERP